MTKAISILTVRRTAFSLAIFLVVAAPYANAEVRSDQSAKATARYSTLKQDDAKLEEDIRLFLRGTKNINSKEEGPVADQVIEHIALPSQPFTTHLSEGGWLISGSLPHAAETKGAVIVDRYGEIKAVALLEYAGERNLVPFYETWIYVKNEIDNSNYIREIDRYLAGSPKIPHKIYVLRE